MPDFGVTDAGYVLPTQQQLLALMVADQKATIGPSVDTSSDSVLGQINGVVTRQLMIGYEGQQIAYYSNDPDVVEGVLQTALAKVTGTPRQAATTSKVTLSCVLDVGTVLLAGVSLAAALGNPASQWTPVADFTAPSTSTHQVEFESVTTGPNAAAPGSITVITTTVVGWNSVTNAFSPDPGTDVEPDPDLRIRREQELEGGGAANVDAIRAALLQIGGTVGPFVLSAWVLNNVSDVTDANGVPPHSTEAIVWDGEFEAVGNDTIAQVLWDEGSAGIRNFGMTSGTATDALGNPQTVFFSRVEQLLIYAAFGVTPRQGYVGDTAFKAAVAAACNGDPTASTEQQKFGISDDVDPYDVVLNTAGLGAQVTGLVLALVPIAGTPGAISSTSLPVGPRQIAIFDSSRITVNGA
jgi:hypothetical protein